MELDTLPFYREFITNNFWCKGRTMILRIEVNEDTFYLLSCCQRITNKANFHIYN